MATQETIHLSSISCSSIMECWKTRSCEEMTTFPPCSLKGIQELMDLHWVLWWVSECSRTKLISTERSSHARRSSEHPLRVYTSSLQLCRSLIFSNHTNRSMVDKETCTLELQMSELSGEPGHVPVSAESNRRLMLGKQTVYREGYGDRNGHIPLLSFLCLTYRR